MIPLMKNAFSNEYETRKALAEFLVRAPKLSMDECCLSFELAFARQQGSSHAVLFNSGGSANLAILQALKNLGRIHSGAKIGFSALTWSTNVMPIIQLGFRPVPVDCSPTTLNVMSRDLEDKLNSCQVEAFFATNVLGFAGDLPRIKQICEDRKILLMEDNCEALGSQLPGGRTGSFGLASSFSFFVAHHLSTIEGGCVCTNDDELAEMLTIVRANGWDRNLNAEQQTRWRQKNGITSEFDAKYSFIDLAFNFRPTEITGFLGLQQLKYLEANGRRRFEIYQMLEGVVRPNPDLVPLDYSHMLQPSPFAFPVVCRTEALRDQYLRQFAGAGIEVRPMIAGNMTRQPFYRLYDTTEHSLPGADMLHSCSFYCGLYPELSQREVETISSCVTRR
jgi:CDP-6-deoxy-D-xylo-4-hexulose-3-dehydrase